MKKQKQKQKTEPRRGGKRVSTVPRPGEEPDGWEPEEQTPEELAEIEAELEAAEQEILCALEAGEQVHIPDEIAVRLGGQALSIAVTEVLDEMIMLVNTRSALTLARLIYLLLPVSITR